MWKERLWQVFLVAILGLTLTMCSRSGGNNNSSSSSNANAEETPTVSVSSMPSLKVESLPSMTIIMDNSSATPVAVTSFPTVTVILANAGLNAISQTMICTSFNNTAGLTYNKCDASDDTVLSNYSITHDAALAAGWKLVGPACSAAGGMSYNTLYCFLFHK